MKNKKINKLMHNLTTYKSILHLFLVIWSMSQEVRSVSGKKRSQVPQVGDGIVF